MTVAPNPFAIAADLLFPEPSPYLNDPVGWATNRLSEFWWSGQREIAEMVVRNRYSAIKASHDVSKSHTVSRLGCWWIDVHPPGEAFVVTTAPTTAQVEAILWRYIGAAHRKASLPGRITLDAKWYVGQELVAYGRKPADYDQAAFQGIHARYVLVIIDEAGGVPKSIFDAVDALATNIDARVVAVGNPDDPASHFATICKPGSGWAVKKISAFDTPAYTGEKVPAELLPLLVSPEWVEERKVRWGVTSPIYQSKVLGEFPDLSDDTLILPKWIEAAQKRTLERTRRPIIAADIARFGEDETVIMRREGGWIRVHRAHHKDDTMTTAGHIAKAMRDIDDEAGKNDWVRAIVDVPGVGGGVVDRLAELDLPVVPYNGGEAPIDKERFVNARAEDYWTLRERFEQGEVDIDPDDDKLAAQLGSIKWGIDSRGRIKIESKDDMRRRGLPSPDRADTCIAEGIPVATSRGDVAIESVVPGDEVWTRRGWRRVLEARKTFESAEVMRIVAGGIPLELTPDHEVFVIGKGFIRADAVNYGDKLLRCQTLPSVLSSETGFSVDHRMQSPAQPGFITPPIPSVLARNVQKALVSFMWRSGKLLTQTRSFRLGGLFITLTKTRSTMTRATLCVLAARNMPSITRSSTTRPNFVSTWAESERRHRPGTARRKDVPGMSSLAVAHGRVSNRQWQRARSAVSRTQRSIQIAADIAQRLAISGRRGRSGDTPFRSSAQSAHGRSCSSSTRAATRLLAAVPVEQLFGGVGKTTVYDLTVEGEPEFFANGILVHNCAMIFSGRANAAPMNVESHAGGSITGDLMTKAW